MNIDLINNCFDAVYYFTKASILCLDKDDYDGCFYIRILINGWKTDNHWETIGFDNLYKREVFYDAIKDYLSN